MFRFFLFSITIGTWDAETEGVQRRLADAATLTDSAAAELARETSAVAEDVRELEAAKHLVAERKHKVQGDKQAIQSAKRELKLARRSKKHDAKAHAGSRKLSEDEARVRQAKLSVDAWKGMKEQDKRLLSDAKKRTHDAKLQVKRDKKTLKAEKKMLLKAGRSVEADGEEEVPPLQADGDVSLVQEDIEQAKQGSQSGVYCWLVGC